MPTGKFQSRVLYMLLIIKTKSLFTCLCLNSRDSNCIVITFKLYDRDSRGQNMSLTIAAVLFRHQKINKGFLVCWRLSILSRLLMHSGRGFMHWYRHWSRNIPWNLHEFGIFIRLSPQNLFKPFTTEWLTAKFSDIAL